MLAELLKSSYFALFLIVALGFMLGRIKVKGVSLDVSAVIFIALLFGHYGVIIPKELGNFGLVLFIFTIGIQAGPGFFDSFRSKGKTLIIITLLLVCSAALSAVGMKFLFGLDVASNIEYMTKFTKTLNDKGIIVSMFIDPDSTQIEASAKAGAQFIELHTGQYAEKFNTPDEEKELNKLIDAAQLAKELGLKVNAGHGLNYFNVKPVASIENMVELNIGHSIISKAVFVGLDRAVRDMISLIK